MKSFRLSVMLFCLTANHRNTEFEVLERISHLDASAADLVSTHDFVRGAVVLSTCNRFEAYLEIDEPLVGAAAIAREAVIDALGLGEDAARLRDSAVALAGDDVVRHLFAVTAGLESMARGEEEISGQVRRALVTAQQAGATSTELEQVFQRAVAATREMRAKADLAAGGRSLARLALDLADARVIDWAAVRVLIVGTGQYAATTIAALRARGVGDVRVFSATGRADTFAARYAAKAVHELRPAIGEADLVITCTSRYTISPADIPDHEPRLIIDLGLPRNVEPAVRELPGVSLLDLELLGKHAALPELGAAAHDIMGSAASSFSAERAASAAVVALRGHVQAVLDAELARLRPGVASDDAAAALRRFAGIIAHSPSVRAREFAAAGRLGEFEDALATVFGIEVPPADTDEGLTDVAS